MPTPQDERARRLADPENRRQGAGELNRVSLSLDGRPAGGHGVVVLPCGAGKTIVSMVAMARSQPSTARRPAGRGPSVASARANGNNFALLGLFLGGIGNDDATGSLGVFLKALHYHAIVERTELHGLNLLISIRF